MRKHLFLIYGIACYILGFAAFLYLIGFLADVLVPKSISSGPAGPFWPALAVDSALIALFGLQHSVMARPTFKRWWTGVVPRPIERSTYVLLTALALALVFWQWRPLPGVVWNVEATGARWLLWALFALGWIVVYVSTRLINSDHLFGVQQVRRYRQGKNLAGPEFQTPLFYRYVRHPLLLGFLIAFWATPHMTVGRLLFALAMTGYVLVAIPLEERNLVDHFGERYRQYRERVPTLVPTLSDGISQQK